MATKYADSHSRGVVNFATGSFTSDNTDTTVVLGFKPRHIVLLNATDLIRWEKFEGMTDAQTAKLVNADTTQQTLDTGDAITIEDNGFIAEAATVGSSKAIRWAAWG